jgi:type IV secretory pathway TrbF-like protein
MPTRGPAPERTRSGKTETRGPLLARALAGVVVAALCLALTPIPAMAAGNSVDPSTYTHSVCTALDSYKSQVTSIQASSNLSSASNLTEVRDRLVTFLTQVRAASNSAVTSLQNAGAPTIKNGNKVAALIVNEITTLRDAFAKAARAAQALNLNSVTSFRSATQAIGKRINAAGATASHVLDNAKKRYNISALKAAEAQDPTCQGLK